MYLLANKMRGALAVIMTFISAATQGSSGEFDRVSAAINELIKQMWPVCLAIAGSLAAIWGIYLGIKFWTAGGDEQKKKSAKTALIQFVVGIVIIFVVAVGAPLAIGALSAWASNYNTNVPQTV